MVPHILLRCAQRASCTRRGRRNERRLFLTRVLLSVCVLLVSATRVPQSGNTCFACSSSQGARVSIAGQTCCAWARTYRNSRASSASSGRDSPRETSSSHGSSCVRREVGEGLADRRSPVTMTQQAHLVAILGGTLCGEQASRPRRLSVKAPARHPRDGTFVRARASMGLLLRNAPATSGGALLSLHLGALVARRGQELVVKPGRDLLSTREAGQRRHTKPRDPYYLGCMRKTRTSSGCRARFLPVRWWLAAKDAASMSSPRVACAPAREGRVRERQRGGTVRQGRTSEAALCSRGKPARRILRRP